jgi:hypothetical protein
MTHSHKLGFNVIVLVSGTSKLLEDVNENLNNKNIDTEGSKHSHCNGKTRG